MTLINAKAGDRVRIVGMGKDVEKPLVLMGINAGDVVKITHVAPFCGGFAIRKGNITVAVGRREADAVMVENVS